MVGVAVWWLRMYCRMLVKVCGVEWLVAMLSAGS